MNNVHYSSETNEWATPEDVYLALHREFDFTLDPCCTHDNAKCERHFTLTEDGLSRDWGREIVFMNPPYGREIILWMQKAYESSLKGATVVCLVPAHTDTKWWHDFAMNGEIRFLRGRIKFKGPDTLHRFMASKTTSAPFPSAVVVFRPHNSVISRIEIGEKYEL